MNRETHLLLPVLLTGAFLVTFTSTTSGEEFRERFENHVFTTDHGSLPYRLLVPQEYDPGQQYPLVVFFHGAGERGSDNVKQLVHAMADFASDQVMKDHPCFVVAPQCPEDSKWVDIPWTTPSHTMPAEPAVPMQLTLELMEKLQKEFSIDDRRIYVTGLSMGGYAVWDVIQRYPHRFAAGVPICGGGDSALAAKIAHVPVWVFHGDADDAVPPRRSRDMVAALKAAGGSPRYTEYPGVGHHSWVPTYADPEMYAWLFSQEK